ncbi:MAG: prolipoprotein diacylglyceryl transferase [Candidatus Omnitrophota bacterium]
MYPVIYSFRYLTMYSYGLMVAFAIGMAAFLLTRQAKKQGFNPELIYNLCFIAFFSGIIGARILYIILNFDYYLDNPFEVFMLNRGGLVWFGGFILASLSCVIYLKHKQLDIYKILDLAIPYVALGQAIGRIGCFLNGCCFGNEVLRGGLYFPVHHRTLIPVQLYSSLFLLGIYITLRILQGRTQRKGEIFYFYIFLYSLTRFFVEFIRGDSGIFILGLSVFQVISIVLFIFSLVMLTRIKGSKA